MLLEDVELQMEAEFVGTRTVRQRFLLWFPPAVLCGRNGKWEGTASVLLSSPSAATQGRVGLRP